MTYCQWLLQKLIEEAEAGTRDVSEILFILSGFSVKPKRDVLRQLAKLWSIMDEKTEIKQFIIAYACLRDRDDRGPNITKLVRLSGVKLLMRLFLEFYKNQLN